MTNYCIDRQKWAQMSVFQQMGNIGAEVGRTLNYKRKGKQHFMNNAMLRTLDLFDATEEVWLESQPYRLRELNKARSEFLKLFFMDDDDETFEKEAHAIDAYFTQYAIAANRSNR